MRRATVLLLLLGGCAGSIAPAMRIVTVPPELPPALLTCSLAPAVPEADS